MHSKQKYLGLVLFAGVLATLSASAAPTMRFVAQVLGLR
jgi:hypothetical protein